MTPTGVQRQLSAQIWRPAPEKDPKPELNAQTGTKAGIQLQEGPLHVQHSKLSPSTHQVGPGSGFRHQSLTHVNPSS